MGDGLRTTPRASFRGADLRGVGFRGPGFQRAWGLLSAVGFGLGVGAGAMLVGQGRPPQPSGPHAELAAGSISTPAAAQPSRDVVLRTLTARAVRVTDDDGNVVLELSGDDLGGLVEARKPDGTPLDQFPSLTIRGTHPPEPDVIITPATPKPAPESGPPAATPKPPPQIPAWEIPENWGKLYRYMSKSAAAAIMGDPERVQKTSYGERWYYGTGYLYFDTGNRLSSWTEPHTGGG